jgi:hypothetical protein
MKHRFDLDVSFCRRIKSLFPRLRRTVRKNLARFTGAFLRLALSVRYGDGGLHLTSLARAWAEGGRFKRRYKRARAFSPVTVL